MSRHPSYGNPSMSCVMGNHALRPLLLSYPKKDWWAGPHQSCFWYDTDSKIVLCCLHRLYSVVGVIPKEGLAGPRPSILLLVRGPPIILLVRQRQRPSGTFSHDSSHMGKYCDQRAPTDKGNIIHWDHNKIFLSDHLI